LAFKGLIWAAGVTCAKEKILIVGYFKKMKNLRGEEIA
jgi:hypothetical protein